MTRASRNFGPALAVITLAIAATGGLVVATSSAATTALAAAVAPASSMYNQGIYGTGIGYDTKANIPIGPDGQKMAIRFKATTTSALNSVRFVQRGGTGYSLGNGGALTLSVRADDGTGHPSATSLAQQSYTPGNPSGAWEKYDPITFGSPATLSAGAIYYIVFTNASTTNYISVNSVYIYSAQAGSARQPMFADSEYGLMYTSGAWGAIESGYTPVADLAYANGTHDGQSYYEAMIDRYSTISGASSMARENFTVSGGARTVASASVRVRRSGGSSPLTLTLETSAGAAIASATVPAANVPVSSPGGDTGGAVWVKANFSSAHLLANGGTYHLRVSTAVGTTYTTFPVRSGADKGLGSYNFTGGTGQFTTNGSTWTDSYAYSKQDLQFYFGLTAPTPTPTPTTTTPPVTTTTTPPVTTTTTPPVSTTTPPPTTAAAATSLQCPIVLAPRVGQTVSCTYR